MGLHHRRRWSARSAAVEPAMGLGRERVQPAASLQTDLASEMNQRAFTAGGRNNSPRRLSRRSRTQ